MRYHGICLGSEENHEGPVGIANIPAKILKERLGRYRSTSPLSLRVSEESIWTKEERFDKDVNKIVQ
jgi:hypothetical protein